MNSQEAYKLLELSPGASKEDIQAAFRKMAKKYHPDRNKEDPEAENKFKQINSAYQLLTNPRPNAQRTAESNHGHSQQAWEDIFAQNFGNKMPFGFNFSGMEQSLRPVQLPNNVVSVTLNFAESVLGCAKEVVMDQVFHCSNCQGVGKIKLAEPCKKCNGQGNVQGNVSRGNVVFMRACDGCHGSGSELKKCDSCSGNGFIKNNGPVNLNIPGGVANGNILRTPTFMLQINVNPDPDMTLENGDVVSVIELSLLEALKGMKKSVRTIKGDMVLKIPPKVKNNDNIVVAGYGVPAASGSHKFNVKVNYLENNDKLIEFLENNINE